MPTLYFNRMDTQILPTDTPALMAAAVEAAARALAAGEVIVVPTETVYGLAANAWNPEAVARIFELKGRPKGNPIIVHVVGREMAEACTLDWPESARELAAHFWPGPLTLVLPKSDRVPDIVTANGSTVGLRWPQHPFIHQLILACGFPLAAPSANVSNQLSPTQARHVTADFMNRVPLIVDGGDCNVGIESTVLDVTQTPPMLLRPGIVSREALGEVLGELPSTLEKTEEIPDLGCAGTAAVVLGTNPDVEKGEATVLGHDSSEVMAGCSTGSQVSSPKAIPPLRSPGLLSRHYAPRAPLHVMRWRSDRDLLDQLSARQDLNFTPETTWVLAHSIIPMQGLFPNVFLIPDDPEAFARALYDQLHQADAAGARRIIVEAVPTTGEWAGIADRLRRASTP